MAYVHGVTITDGGTLGAQISLGGSTYPVFVGSAWGLTTKGTAPLTPKKINNFQEYIETFGWAKRDGVVLDYSAPDHTYNLDEVAFLFFKKYKIGPVVFINVFDGTVHTAGEPLVPDVSVVDETDIALGLELIEGAMTELTFIPSHIAAPRYSMIPALKVVMQDYNSVGGFPVMVVMDCDDNPVNTDVAAKAAAIIEATAITTKNVYLCWPARGGYPLSAIAVALAEWVTITQYAGIPMGSPSNKEILIPFATGDRIVLAAWTNALNEVSIATWRQIRSKCVLYGHQLAPFDFGGVADYVNDSYMPRRMRNYIEERILTEMVDSVDEPTNLRLIEDVVAKLNDFGGALLGKGALLGFRVDFFAEKNPLADLAVGKMTFSVTLLTPTEAGHINFDIITDLTYLTTLFGA